MQGTEREPKIKGKIKRERDDKLIKLNQEQTAMLIYCLRETKIILKDEYLNNSEAGFAFSILTGYSAETLRQNLNLSEKADNSARQWSTLSCNKFYRQGVLYKTELQFILDLMTKKD